MVLFSTLEMIMKQQLPDKPHCNVALPHEEDSFADVGKVEMVLTNDITDAEKFQNNNTM